VLVRAGDFLAISNLIYKIGLELKKNPKSAPDYQHLLIELEALDRALKLLQCIKPAQHELRRLEGIRALASTCQRPLEEFLTKIEKFEEHLGSWNASNHQFSGLTRRLQWSMKYKEEVKSLRAKLAPNVATITVLLATQTIDTLSNAESDRFQIARELNCKLSSQCKILADLKQTTLGITTAQAGLEAEQSHMTAVAAAQDQDLRTLKSKADELLKDNITHEIHLYNQDAILVDIQDNGTTINSRTQETHILATAIRQDTAEIKAATDSVLGRALDLMSAITAGISKIQDIIALIAQMIRLTTQFTIEMRETMGKLLQAFWDIQRQLARLERFLPKQIDLPVVRFRDAFNEMRFLPYDLSRQWQTFQGLVAVVFMNRQGLHRVNMGQYFVTNVRIAQRLNPICWSNAIEPGDELSMTMILDDIEAEDGFCPYKSCGASTKDVASRRGGKTCPNCFRFAAISQRKQAVPPHYEYPSPKSDLESLLDDSDGSEEFVADAAPVHAPELEVLKKEDIELYHSIQVVQVLLTSACDEAPSSKQPSLQTSKDELPLAKSSASTTGLKKSCKITSWDRDSLAGEITQVGAIFTKVEFEAVDIPRRRARISLHGPWASDNSSLYIRVQMHFPKNYPREGGVDFKIQKTAGMTDEVLVLMSTELQTIAETYATKKKGCLEAVLQYLLREQNMEQIVSLVLDEPLAQSGDLDALETPDDLSSDDGDDAVATFLGPSVLPTGRPGQSS